MEVTIADICKSYDNRPVLSHISLKLHSQQRYCLMGPSGSGKTTLLRILLGLEQPDSGDIDGLSDIPLSAVFQENRLCEAFSPIDNIMMVTGKSMSDSEVKEDLLKILPKECLTRPVSTLSGGMKRRVAICRAMMAESDAIFMDEPFTGLDITTKQKVISYILEKAGNKLLLISTHQEEDVAALDGTLILLTK